MRTILFRAKRVDNNEWVIGSYLHDYKDWAQVIATKTNVHEINPETVGQFTGVNDKNGLNIFEGDLLQNDKEIIFEVQWHGALYGFSGYVQKWGSSYSAADFVNYIIVGNIHDNPELLVS